MKVGPILMSAPMMRANLGDLKTKTRRDVSAVEWRRAGRADHALYVGHQGGFWEYGDNDGMHSMKAPKCRYGGPGDLLWVRETCRADELASGEDGVRYLADGHWQRIENTKAAADGWVDLNHYDYARRGKGATVPGIHMPRWASRLTLRLTDVRLERLHAISEADAIAEGISAAAPEYGPAEGIYQCWMPDGKRHFDDSACRLFQKLWEQINGADSWAADPWIWVLSYQVIRQNIDAVLRLAEAA